LLAGWLVVLVTQGAYSSRYFGAGSDEYRAITVASLYTAGAAGTICFLLHLPLSRKS